jgi:N-acetyl-anhydromuramyl-L-alanine amidase AmpD
MAFATIQEVQHLVVHCSATSPKQDIGAKEIDRMHRQKGWRRIGYHYVIRRDGKIEPGRPQAEIGAHVEGHNENSLGICLVGGVTRLGKSEDNFTEDQLHSLAVLLQGLKHTFPQAEILGHRDFPKVAKDCPCFDVRDWWKETVEVVAG